MRHSLHNEKDIHAYVQALKNFYGEFSSFIVVSATCLLIWLLSGLGYFWPIWIILVWGSVLFLKASRLNIINNHYYEICHTFREKLPFIRENWQDEKIKELLEKAEVNSRGGRSKLSAKMAARKKIMAPKMPQFKESKPQKEASKKTPKVVKKSKSK